MGKIALIGAGGVIFARNFLKDLLTNPGLKGTSLTMMDISAERLENARRMFEVIARAAGRANVEVECTTSLRTALEGANYVVTIFRCGTMEHQRLEHDIPARYGVDQVVGDTLNPGGVFRGLRTLKSLFEVVDAMEEICPGAYLFNYVNPMSMNTIALSHRARSVRVIGLCHSVQHTAGELARYLGVPHEELVYAAAGVNHQAFMLKLEHHGCDLYPALRACLEKPEIYRKDKVRFEIFRHFGYFPTESSGHGSEYIPYIRKRPDLIERFCRSENPVLDEYGIDWNIMSAGVGGASLQICEKIAQKNAVEMEAIFSGRMKVDLTPSCEYAMQIVDAIENNRTLAVNLNVMNRGLIATLPPECAVEVPCLVNGAGIFPCRIEDYPEQLAMLNRGMIGVQMLGAEGALTHSREKIFQAVAADPLTAAVLGLDEIRALCDELFEALKSEIEPEFFQ